MTNKLRFLVIALYCALFFTSCKKDDPTPSESEKWSIETIDNTGSPTSMNKIVTDLSSGNHVAYVDENSISTNKIKYAYKALNGVWQTEFVDNDGNCSNWVDITIDTIANKIFIVYVKTGQPTVGEYLMLAEKNIGSTVWTKTAIQNQLNNSSKPRITIDKNQGLHVCYARGGYGYQYYAYRPLNGAFTVSLITQEGDANSAIAVDNGLNIHIAYYKSNSVRYATKTINATDWTISDIKTNIDYGSSTTTSIQISLNPQSEPNVLFINNSGGKGDCIGLATKISSWTSTIFSNIEKANVFSVSMFFVNNRQYITYKDDIGLSGQHFDLRITYNISGTWKTQFVDGNSDNRCGGYNSVYVEKSGKINISYTADTEKVLKYAYKQKIE